MKQHLDALVHIDAGGSGGLIWHHGTCNVDVYGQASFARNQAGERGGLICGSKTDDTEYLQTSFIGHGPERPILRENRAGSEGGCIYVDEEKPYIRVATVEFTDN